MLENLNKLTSIKALYQAFAKKEERRIDLLLESTITQRKKLVKKFNIAIKDVENNSQVMALIE